MGPSLGPQSRDRAGIVVDYFGGTAWKLAGPSTYAKVRTILGAEAPDPAELRRVDCELAPFYCPDCGQNYCRADWDTYVLLDDGFYDCTMGTCPSGHQHMVEDLPVAVATGTALFCRRRGLHFGDLPLARCANGGHLISR